MKPQFLFFFFFLQIYEILLSAIECRKQCGHMTELHIAIFDRDKRDVDVLEVEVGFCGVVGYLHM